MSDVYIAAPVLYCWNSIYPYELMDICKAHQDDETGELVLETMYSTQDPPPPKKEGFAICRDINSNTWVYLPDYRGKLYWEKDASWRDPGCPVIYPGELPEGASLVPPKKPANILRAELKTEIRHRKQQMRKAGVTVGDFGGARFDTDYNAELAYLTFLEETRINPAYTKRWKASDGSWLTMTRDLCLKVRQAVRDHIDSVYAWQERAEILLSRTKDEDLENFDLDGI